MENDAAGYAMEEMRPRFDRIAGRHGNGTAPVAVSAYQLFQTPVPIATHLAELLDLKSMPRPFRMLEPSAGLGRLLDALLPYDPAMVQAVEIATPLCAELYRQDRAKVNLHQRDFLTMTPGDTGFFDAVIMNPPFHKPRLTASPAKPRTSVGPSKSCQWGANPKSHVPSILYRRTTLHRNLPRLHRRIHRYGCNARFSTHPRTANRGTATSTGSRVNR